ncbi:class I SAM-dependent methyltransferase [Chondromyces apiculatus]|uniref:Methyltransferase type 11 n=1 Tax=Chondromyces apiculatus DSM 436 TaxID=1192034 RepID=A0A017SXP6_9BACT|nr:methyltransferase domain-containing protein [Chondromyces apiculatus]EYF01769.1 Methyltransferase type 11 [Chondromyces apiculatus DSM 436]
MTEHASDSSDSGDTRDARDPHDASADPTRTAAPGTPGTPEGPIEWDATAYHRISDPQFRWGLRVLDRLTLQGDEVVMDAGCGSGRLTAELCARLPRGRVVAVDRSQNMLEEARRTLAPFGDRVSFRVVNLQEESAEEPVDVVFSTATFHWIRDHRRLFGNLFASLRPGGRLHAQCGGAGNLHLVHHRAEALMQRPEYAPFFEGWTDPWEFASAESTAERLRDAGFEDVKTDLEEAPTPFPDAASFRIFIERVVLRHHLARLPDEATVAAFLDTLVAQSSRDEPPYNLAYIRLNMQARRPA